MGAELDRADRGHSALRSGPIIRRQDRDGSGDKGEVIPAPAPVPKPADPFAQALEIARAARKIIIVPGYGMALADAQQELSTAVATSAPTW